MESFSNRWIKLASSSFQPDHHAMQYATRIFAIVSSSDPDCAYVVFKGAPRDLLNVNDEEDRGEQVTESD